MGKEFFSAESFSATKWEGADDKAWFANRLCAFVLADMPKAMFTQRFYRRLSRTFGHVAHYDREGFYGHYFTCYADKLKFVAGMMMHPCYGSPEFTYSDVERAVIERLDQSGMSARYQAMAARETEQREREQLAALLDKYGTAGAAIQTRVGQAQAGQAPPSARAFAPASAATLFDLMVEQAQPLIVGAS